METGNTSQNQANENFADIEARLKKAYGDEQGSVMAKYIKGFREEMDRIASNSQKRIEKLVEDSEKRIKEVEKKLEDDVRGRFIPIAIAIATLIIIAVLAYMYNGTKDVNDSVISLQKDIISAQVVISQSDKELQQAIANLKQAQADLEIARKNLDNATKEYQTATANYKELTRQVEDRLKNLKDSTSTPTP